MKDKEHAKCVYRSYFSCLLYDMSFTNFIKYEVIK